jgi:3-methyladenine DNA glycosylase Tag
VFHLKKHQIDDFFSAFVGFDVLKVEKSEKNHLCIFKRKTLLKSIIHHNTKLTSLATVLKFKTIKLFSW